MRPGVARVRKEPLRTQRHERVGPVWNGHCSLGQNGGDAEEAEADMPVDQCKPQTIRNLPSTTHLARYGSMASGMAAPGGGAVADLACGFISGRQPRQTSPNSASAVSVSG